MDLILTIFLLVFLTQLVSWVGTAVLQDLVCSLHQRVFYGAKATEQRRLKTSILTAKKELSEISAQDQFAKWAKLRRKMDKELADLEKLNSELSGNKTAFSLKFGTAIWIFTTGAQFAIGWWYRKTPVFYLPRGWFGPAAWYLSLPFAPAGSVSCGAWQMACKRVIGMMERVVRDHFEPDSVCQLLRQSLELRDEAYLIPESVTTILGLEINVNSAAQLAFLPAFLHPNLKKIELGGYCSNSPLFGLHSNKTKDIQMVFGILDRHDFVALESLGLRLGREHPELSWKLDATLLRRFLRRNPSLKAVNLGLPVRDHRTLETLGDLPQLENLVVRWWKVPEASRIYPERSADLFPSLCHIRVSDVSTFRDIIFPSSASVHTLTSVRVPISSAAEARELFDTLQSCTALQTLHITHFAKPTSTDDSMAPSLSLSISSILSSKSMENFYMIHPPNIIPPDDADLTLVGAAWPSLTRFIWRLRPGLGGRATMKGLNALAAGCRKLRMLAVPIAMVGPDSLECSNVRPFCDDIVIEVSDWRADPAISPEGL
ncbi:GET complex subunit get1, partial [Tulasnella sp. 331]